MSLLREIQNDIASAESNITTVLMKCKILAARLGSVEFSEWVDHELNGYPTDQSLPAYRSVAVIYYASFMNIAWKAERQVIPWQVIPEKYRDSFRIIKFRDGIAKAASFSRSKGGAMIPRADLIFSLQGTMYPDMQCYSVWAEIGRTEFEQMMSAVKNRLLDFALKVEVENPEAGEAPINSRPVPMEKLQPLVHNTFYAPVGNIAQNSESFSQTASVIAQSGDLMKLVTELSTHLAELDLEARQKQIVEAQLTTLKAQLTAEPNAVIVQQAGRTIRNITEGAIGSLLATAAQPAVWQWIHQMLQNF